MAERAGLSLDQRESSPVHLHRAIKRALDSVLDACPATVGKLAEFLDTGVEKQTAARTELPVRHEHSAFRFLRLVSAGELARRVAVRC